MQGGQTRPGVSEDARTGFVASPPAQSSSTLIALPHHDEALSEACKVYTVTLASSVMEDFRRQYQREPQFSSSLETNRAVLASAGIYPSSDVVLYQHTRIPSLVEGTRSSSPATEEFFTPAPLSTPYTESSSEMIIAATRAAQLLARVDPEGPGLGESEPSLAAVGELPNDGTCGRAALGQSEQHFSNPDHFNKISLPKYSGSILFSFDRVLKGLGTAPSQSGGSTGTGGITPPFTIVLNPWVRQDASTLLLLKPCARTSRLSDGASGVQESELGVHDFTPIPYETIAKDEDIPERIWDAMVKGFKSNCPAHVDCSSRSIRWSLGIHSASKGNCISFAVRANLPPVARQGPSASSSSTTQLQLQTDDAHHHQLRSLLASDSDGIFIYDALHQTRESTWKESIEPTLAKLMGLNDLASESTQSHHWLLVHNWGLAKLPTAPPQRVLTGEILGCIYQRVDTSIVSSPTSPRSSTSSTNVGIWKEQMATIQEEETESYREPVDLPRLRERGEALAEPSNSTEDPTPRMALGTGESSTRQSQTCDQCTCWYTLHRSRPHDRKLLALQLHSQE